MWKMASPNGGSWKKKHNGLRGECEHTAGRRCQGNDRDGRHCKVEIHHTDLRLDFSTPLYYKVTGLRCRRITKLIYSPKKLTATKYPIPLNDPHFVFSGPPKGSSRGGHLHMLNNFQVILSPFSHVLKGPSKKISPLRHEGSFRGVIYGGWVIVSIHDAVLLEILNSG